MANKKMIPCRVCGKEFEPCSYCQSHGDVFRWRNFACSRECAKKYIDEAVAYREEQQKQRNNAQTVEETKNDFSAIMNEPIVENTEVIEETPVQKKKSTKKKNVEMIESYK